MAHHGRLAVRACGPRRRFAIRAVLWSTVAFTALLLGTLKFRREVPEHTEAWPIGQTSARADGHGNGATAPVSSLELRPVGSSPAIEPFVRVSDGFS
jgi:hypothetical protein